MQITLDKKIQPMKKDGNIIPKKIGNDVGRNTSDRITINVLRWTGKIQLTTLTWNVKYFPEPCLENITAVSFWLIRTEN